MKLKKAPNFSEFDVVILHSTQELKTQALKILVTKMSGARTRFVVYTHIWISHSKQDPLHRLLYSMVDEVWCGSESSKRDLERMLPLSPAQIRVVRYGRRVTEIRSSLLSRDEARHRLQIPQDLTVVGTMSRVDRGKGSRELFQSVTELMQENRDLFLLMIGPPTASDPKAIQLDTEIESQIQALEPSVRNRVRKVGRLENGSQFLRAFDLFVLATYKENFALSLLDALLAEVPCLATDSGGSPDVVIAGRTGWLFKPESKDELTTALKQALADRTQWSNRGQAGREWVEKNYDFETVIETIELALHSLVETSNLSTP